MSDRDEPMPQPWSPQAEMATIGSAFLDSDAVATVAGWLPASKFFDHRNRAIWAVIVEMVARREPVDSITTFERLRSQCKEEKDFGGLAYIHELAMCVPSAVNMERYAATVASKATLREIAVAADSAQRLARAPGELTPAEVLDQVATLFGKIQRTRSQAAPRRLDELVLARQDHWQALAAGETSPGVPTGLKSLDSALGGGLKPGKVITLAARPSVGKTSLGGQLGLRVAQQGHGVLMLSQEMPAGDLVDRSMANLGDVNLERLTMGALQDGEWSRLADASQLAAGLPFFVDDQPALTLLDIRAKARQVSQQLQGGLALVIVDYLQLCASSGRQERRHHQIEEISRGMKTMAKELGVCVLVLSQLTRESEKDEPELSHLKESGAIEEDADVVILLHPMGKEADGSLLTLAKIPKNRQGRRGRLALSFDGRTQRWAESAGNVERRRGAGGL